jgi:hypothetical protein
MSSTLMLYSKFGVAGLSFSSYCLSFALWEIGMDEVLLTWPLDGYLTILSLEQSSWVSPAITVGKLCLVFWDLKTIEH